ncbi:MAG: 3-hydroxyacyl-CoA dehydrogenase [Beijerinckiaceae bacterium]
MIPENKTIAIIGAGLVGRGWASLFALSGWTVRLYDAMPGQVERCQAMCRLALNDLARYGLAEDANEAFARIKTSRTMLDAVRDASLVQENGPETVEAKTAIYADLDNMALPDAILASSSSSIVASRFTEKLKGRHRCLVAHPLNPPHLVPIVELCGAPWTSPEVIAQARAIYESVGQTPIDVRQEIDGFVLNRLQGALLTEAMRLVGEGYVSPQDLDKAVKDGLGLQWSFIGPFESIELNAPGGMQDYLARYAGFFERNARDPAPSTAWQGAGAAKVLEQWGRTLEPSEILARSRARDERLTLLKAFKKKFKR